MVFCYLRRADYHVKSTRKPGVFWITMLNPRGSPAPFGLPCQTREVVQQHSDYHVNSMKGSCSFWIPSSIPWRVPSAFGSRLQFHEGFQQTLNPVSNSVKGSSRLWIPSPIPWRVHFTVRCSKTLHLPVHCKKGGTQQEIRMKQSRHCITRIMPVIMGTVHFTAILNLTSF